MVMTDDDATVMPGLPLLGAARGERRDNRVALLLIGRSRAVCEHGEAGREGEADDHHQPAERPKAAQRDVPSRGLRTPLVRGRRGHDWVIASSAAMEVTGV
jgi:hypothetical protein